MTSLTLCEMLCVCTVYGVQEERVRLLKSLQEKQELKRRLTAELSQYKDCDPATVKHMRTSITYT